MKVNMQTTDIRWSQLADVLVNHSTAVRPGDRVMIAMGEIESLPLAHAVNDAVVRAGGFPQVQYLSEHFRHSILEHGSAEQLAWTPEIEAHGMEWADVYIALRGGRSLDVHSEIASDRLAVNQAAQGRVSSLRWKNTRWVLVRVPTEDMAADAGVPLPGLLDDFFKASLLDWEVEVPVWQGWADRLNAASEIRIVGDRTDLRFSVEGRTWIASPGQINIPDGEIMTAPVEGTVEGTIYFENPAVLGGRLVSDLTLTWEEGRLTRATSSDAQDFLETVLATDAGATQIGEFALGTNPWLKSFSNDILLDEKIFGTCHIALGRAYPECGGTIESAIHWDIVKDLRADGAVYADGRAILERGTFAL